MCLGRDIHILIYGSNEFEYMEVRVARKVKKREFKSSICLII